MHSDAAVKQILLELDENGPSRFIVQDLDETHVMIDSSSLERVQAQLAEELEKNNYVQVDL